MAAITGTVIAGATLANTVYQGNKARSDAKSARNAQLAATQEASLLQQQAQDQLRSDLDPYRQAGSQALPILQQETLDPQAQYDFLQSNPIFQASLNASDREAVGAAARQGRIGTGGFSQQLQENYILNALPLLQQRQQGLTNLAQIGQNSAAQVGTAGLNTAGNVGQLGLQGANAQAAYSAASSQNRQQTANNVLGGASTLVPLLADQFGNSGQAGTRPADYTGQDMQNWIANQ